jgi:hypothetical protein
LEGYDIVITTFQTVASEFGVYEPTVKPSKPESDSDSDEFSKKVVRKGGQKGIQSLFDVKWLRVVVGAYM